MQALTNTSTNKYNFNNWDCVKKLFPNLTSKIKQSDVASGSSAPTSVKNAEESDFPVGWNFDKHATPPIPLYLEIAKSTQNFVSCAIFDWRGGNDASQEKIYFKSEVVVRVDNYGWVIWNGLSSDPSNSSKKIDFEYRLLTFKKTGSNWEIDRGFRWSQPTSNSSPGQNVQLEVKIPENQKWKEINSKAGDGFSRRKVWSAIAKEDLSSEKHLIESLEVYMRPKGSTNEEDVYNTEFFGLDGGKWTKNGQGYTKSDKMYVKDQGWQTIASVDLGSTLTAWYKPFKEGISNSGNELGVSWMSCDQWVQGQNAKWEATMKEMCYSSKSQ